jgi:predicted small secreted protein
MRRSKKVISLVALLSLVVAACAGAAASEEDTTTTSEPVTTTAAPAITTTTETMDDHGDHGGDDGEVDAAEIIAANLATAGFQDVAVAEAAGYGNTMEALGCFENPEVGGMGLHFLREDLMDDVVEVTEPEALVYELDHNGEITGLVAHEYIVPVEAWTSDQPPTLFGLDFHQHPVLPLWVLHAWIWKDNPAGMFEDWNPKVRMCPQGVPIFGVDLP